MSMQDTLDAIEHCNLTHEDKAKVTRLIRLIAKPASRMESFELQLAREAAGLTVRQAAKLLKLKVTALLDIEAGGWEAGTESELTAAMDELYGIGSRGESCPA
jgi:hypothetical protein